MDVVVVSFVARELAPDVGQRVEHVGDGDVVRAPHLLRLAEPDAHGRCHSLPSCCSSLAAEGGPQVPPGYVSNGGRPLRHASSIGSTSDHAASTSSARVNNV